MRAPVSAVPVQRIEGASTTPVDDIVVVEEPLEIRLGYGSIDDRKEIRLSVTMRTPGNEEDLVLGFLFTEGIIASAEDVVRVVPCENVKEEERGNVYRAELRPVLQLDPYRWQRNFYTTSSCGVCGKSSIEAVHAQCRTRMGRAPILDPSVITALPERMRAAQTVFKHTGGIHAAALFATNGELLLLCEDIGRHNAVDKVIGSMIRTGRSVEECILLVSGRAGFELVQKAVMAGIPVMAAVGAPSSLAVRAAQESGLTLIGFLRGERFNFYSGRTH